MIDLTDKCAWYYRLFRDYMNTCCAWIVFIHVRPSFEYCVLKCSAIDTTQRSHRAVAHAHSDYVAVALHCRNEVSNRRRMPVRASPRSCHSRHYPQLFVAFTYVLYVSLFAPLTRTCFLAKMIYIIVEQALWEAISTSIAPKLADHGQ